MKNPFPILAIETSGTLCSVALLLDEKKYHEINILDKHVHSEKLLEMIDAILKMSGRQMRDLSHIAVSNGPGSFTGLRIGLSAAKGLAFGASLPIIPVPTFAALALQISNFISAGEKFGIIKNASVEDAYYSEFIFDGKDVNTVETVQLIHKNDLKEKAKNLKFLFGDQIANFEVRETIGPHAYYIGLWSYLFGKDLLIFDYDYLEPNYLKKFIAKVKK
ncbi:MAG: tRNA (adenosine(37)-N6)-threonylcarbamoyltransferase complex dimerization subunit type 1 TsaB [Ignavibacteriales bacterium]|nr:tRNA (adenosine(37)-N6)-threonylcarbamoyltransferase complex dimerization subunit type 1 TsaB [Ignavibacteriales bacterium]